MGWFRRTFRRPLPQSEAAPPEPPINPTELLRVLLVDKLKAEVELERARAEAGLKLLKEKEELRVIRREQARLRNKTLPRDRRGYLMKASTVDCRICAGAIDFTEDELTTHRTHSRNGASVKPVVQ